MMVRATPLHIADTPLCFIYRVSIRFYYNQFNQYIMREILFRAKRVDNGEWVEGNLITNERDESKAYIGYIFDVRNRYPADARA